MTSYVFLLHAMGPWGEENTKRFPNFNINQASWSPASMKRQKFKWTSFSMIRWPESLWRMSYGYFWRMKCWVFATGQTLNSQGWNYLKRDRTDVLSTCHWRSVFFPRTHRSTWKSTDCTRGLICNGEIFCRKLSSQSQQIYNEEMYVPGKNVCLYAI